MRMDIRFLIASTVLLVHCLHSRAFAVGNASIHCIVSERLSLLSLKQGFVDRYGHLDSWGNAENQTECCYWLGVFCHHQMGHVVELQLAYSQLEGTITPSLAELHHLNSLDLSGNDFNLTQFPSFISSLKKLEYLDLSHLNLKGKIPYQLGDLFHLQSLDLSGNQLEGGISKSLALCNLEYLDLNNNSLSGQIDDFVASFSQCANKPLQYLDLSHNQLVGPLPNFSHVLDPYHLDLGHNQLNGVVSETHFLRLSHLDYLDLSFNQLVFKVNPDWIPPFQLSSILLASTTLGPDFPVWLRTQKSSIFKLDISCNNISSTIPSWFGDLPFTESNISHNQITGELPNVQCSLIEFGYIDLSSNLIEGSIPSNFSCLTVLDLSNNKFINANSLLCPNVFSTLWVLDLSNNQLSGVLPNCWIYFPSLQLLNVANNSFFGKVPTSMGSLEHIKALHLGYNKFVGEIPSFLNKCKELVSLDVVQNNFSGQIPSWIGDGLKKLRVLILRSNMFSGSLPSTICHLSQAQILDLSLNNISGNLPRCLNNFSALATLTNFDATISYLDDFDMPNIVDIAIVVWKGRESKYKSILGLVKMIDLSSNMLVGEIPSELIDLVGLVSLNISRNMISGQIPVAIGQLKSLDSLDLSRNHLFGRIPSELSHIDRLSVMDLSYNNLSGEIPLGTQLQSFDPSTYVGNAELCGAPLQKCPTKQMKDNQNDGNLEKDKQFFVQGFFISLSIGFSTGFCGVCMLIILNKSWRYAYFRLLNDTYDKIYVVVAINVAKLRWWYRVST